MKISIKKRNIIIISIVSILALILLASSLYYFFVTLPANREREKQLNEFKEYYALKLSTYAEENELYDDYEVDIAFIGDSLIDGYDVKSYYSDTDYLVVNRGIGGETTYGLKNRLSVSVLDLKPKICAMLIGANNYKTMFEDYEDLIITMKQQMPYTKIVLISHAPTSGEHWGPKNQTFAYNNVKIKKLAEIHDCEFVDIYSPMFDITTGEMYTNYTIDGGHFSAQGYEVVTKEIKAVVGNLITNWHK